MEELQPIRLTADDLRCWKPSPSRFFEVSCRVARHAPRGKGWLPRQIGRTFGRHRCPVMRTIHGTLLAVDTSNLDVYTAYALEPYLSEADVIFACRSVLTPASVLYDVGANAGYVFVALTRLLAGRLRSVAFEPQPSLARAAAVSAALNGFADVSVFPTLVGPKSGEATLFIETGAAQASLRSASTDGTRLVAPMVALDDFVQRGDAQPPDLIKVDVEGAEIDVFRGAEALIRTRQPYLVFETFPHLMARFGTSRAELLRYLHALGGYTFYATDAKYPEVLTPEPVEGPHGTSPNILAVPPGRAGPTQRTRPAADAGS